jgi:ubiquinone/menaquinone biosynthesis C-methylase UbiE
MSKQTQQFYDKLAGDYHLIFADWKKSVQRQGVILDKLIRKQGFEPPANLLDCSCGIGTQAIGLALQGYEVQGTDLSPKSIARAKKEAKNFGVNIKFQPADFRKLSQVIKDQFEIVITCDNSLPHLLTDNDLALAIKNIYKAMSPNSLLVASIRDYDTLLKEKPTVTPVTIYGKGDDRYFSFQEWTWDEKNPVYSLNHFIVKKQKNSWKTECRNSKYRAIKRAELTAFLKAEGLSSITWHMPEETGYYQPIVTAKKR